MQIQKVDAVGSEPSKTFLALALKGLGPGVVNALARRPPVQAPFGGDYHFVAARAEGLANQAFALAIVP